MKQKIITSKCNYKEFDEWLDISESKRLLIVCDSSICYFDDLNRHLKEIEKCGLTIIKFNDFKPNPTYESVVNGVEIFRSENCDSIAAIGGGSAIDVAKCIKLYSNMDSSKNYLEQKIITNNIPFLAMPTTAGTGSEATRYAVIYYNGEKQSVTHESCIPQTVLLDSSTLKTLPLYQKKSTMSDAMCHALESFWSVNSSEESRKYSQAALEAVMRNMDGYFANTDEGNAGMLMAAYTAGKAINITQTTAGHAMCYKITSLFGCAHGHAAFLCSRKLFPWMLGNIDKCVDPRGREFLENVFEQIGIVISCSSAEAAAVKLERIFDLLEFDIPVASEEQFKILRNSVNPVRLKNNPVALDIDTIDLLYRKILNGEVK